MSTQTVEETLLARAYEPLPLGHVKPAGWLRRQLRIQADGLSGHLDEFWPDIRDSGWLGGAAEGWERGPYWLDGAVPLAFLLEDEELTEKVDRWMDYILAHQHEDGWLGPIQDKGTGKYKAYDSWPVFVFLKAAIQYWEMRRDKRIVPAISRFLHRVDVLLDKQPLFRWGRFRWADLVLSIHWLHERTGEDWLLALARKVHDQGFDWRGHFEGFPFKDRMRKEQTSLVSHVVNNAMAIKQPAVWWRQSRRDADRQGAALMMDMLDRYHGQATGLFTGDEHLAGLNPSQGTELCAVAEYMFSLELLMAILGKPEFGDRLEKIAFNAWPATFKPDMWAHQYDQQANQAVCRIAEDRIYTTNNKDSNLFGLEPNYGCCTANMHQGWPKFTTHLWMKTPDDGIAAVAYAPSTVHTVAGGQAVRITLDTDYPFGEELRITVESEAGARFPLLLRIPGWADNAIVAVGAGHTLAQAGAFHRIEREWRGRETVTLLLPMELRTRRRFNDSVAITRGPLVYALRMGEDWRRIKGEPPHADWEVHPTTPWNYALAVDPRDPRPSIQFEQGSVGDCPFSPDDAPVTAKVKGRRVPDWRIERNAAGPLPHSPVTSDQPLEELTLIPYGCTNLRVTEFPVLAPQTGK